MKNFKKVLALVLAVVMVMAMVVNTSAASEDFTDAADIDYTEAVDVLSYLNVLGGFPAGDFQPDGLLTRAQAAKIVAIFDNADTNIASYYAGACTFADCADSWAKSFIGYCVKAGIVNGVSATEYAPNETLTGVQFLKMIEAVLGFDVEEEGLVGTSWDVNTLYLAKQLGLLDGLADGFDAFAKLTRQEAAQIMLNALSCSMYYYGKLVIGEKDKAYYLEQVIETTAIATEATFGELAFDVYTRYYDVDVYGTPGHDWYDDANNAIIGTYEDAPVATYVGIQSACDMLKDQGYEETNKTNVTFKLYIDGTEQRDVEVSHTNKSCDATCGNYGALTKVYEAGENNYIVVVKNFYFGKITEIEEAAHKVEEYVGVKYCNCGNAQLEQNEYEVDSYAGALDDYAEGDYVLMNGTCSTEDVLGVQTKVASAKLEKIDLKNYALTFDGTAYDEAAYIYTPDGLTVGNTYDIYTYEVEGETFIIAAIESAKSYVYGVFSAIVWNKGGLDGAYASANIVTMDANTDTKGVTLADSDFAEFHMAYTQLFKYFGGFRFANAYSFVSETAADNMDASSATGFGSNLMKLFINADGNYEVVEAGTFEAVDAIVNGKAQAFDYEGVNVFTNANTEYLVKGSDGNYTAYTGFAAVPAMTSTEENIYCSFMTDGKYVTKIYVDASEATYTGSTKTIYFNDADYDYTDGDGEWTIGYELDNFNEDGSMVEDKYLMNSKLSAAGLYTVKFDASGKCTSCEPVATLKWDNSGSYLNTKLVVAFDGTVLYTDATHNTRSKTIADGCIFYNVDGSLAVSSADDFADAVAAEGSHVIVQYAVANSSGLLTAVYYTTASYI